MNTTPIDNLPVVIDRAQLQTILDQSEDILNDAIGPMLESTELYVTTLKLKFQSPAAIAVDKELKRVTTGSARNPIDRITQLVETIRPNVATIEKLVQRHLPTKIPRASLTFRQLAVVKLVIDVHVFTRYSLALLSYLSTAEIATAHKIKLDQLMNRFSLQYIDNNWDKYVVACRNLAKRKEELEKEVTDVTDTSANLSDEELTSSVHGNVDPFKFNYIGTEYNFLKRILMGRAESAAKAYHAAIESKTLYEIQLNNLETVRARQGKLDPGQMQRMKELRALVEASLAEAERLEKAYA